MKNKVRLVTIAGILLIAALVMLPFWIRGRRMENRYKANSELFQATAEAFCNAYVATDWPVLVYKSDFSYIIGREDVADEYGFSKSDIRDMKRIFRTSNCYSIYAGELYSGGLYCKFNDGGINLKTGLIYISNAEQVAERDAENLVESCIDLYVETAYFIDKQWIYYEGIPSYAMD